MEWNLESLIFNNPFEIIRTRSTSIAHQSNQNHGGKISKAVLATCKIHHTLYAEFPQKFARIRGAVHCCFTV